MKNLSLLTILISAFSLVAFTSISLNKYEITEDYSIKFDGGGAAGTFSGLTGEIVFDKDNLDASRIKVSVDAATIRTGNKTKDKHARGESWFDVESYPNIIFTSEKFEKTADGYSVKGMLEMHGFKKSETIPFTFKNNIFEGKVMIDRQEYGIEGPFFAFTVSNEFEVNLRVPVK